MTWHDACTSGTSWVLTVASLQWLKMEALIPSPSDCEVWSVIKFLNAQSIAPIEIHRLLYQIYGPNIMRKHKVYCWCRKFKAGRRLVHEEESSRSPSIIMDNLMELVWERIMENHCFTIMELSSHFLQVSCSLHKIVMEHLFRKLCTRWMPKQLTPEHKANHMESALTVLQQYYDDSDEFLDRIITGDEMWVAHITPETKQQSTHWHHRGSSCTTKFKQTLLAQKVMCTVSWDRWHILLIDFLTRGEMVNAEHYCRNCNGSFRTSVQDA